MEQDIGRPSGSDLRGAVDTIAERLRVEDRNDGLPRRRPAPEPAAVGAP